jgi:hypothetical protein
MYSESAQNKLIAALIYFGDEASEFTKAIDSGIILEQHKELDKHAAELVSLLRKAVNELKHPSGGGTVASSSAYKALKNVAEAVQSLCEETHIVQKPLPGRKPRL